MPAKKKTKTIKFKYVIPDELPDYYVNGAFGGVTPRNELYIHFFSERNPIPKELSVRIESDSKKVLSEKEIAGGDVIRLIQSSLVMNLDTAIALRDWFVKMVEKMQPKESQALNEEPKDNG